MKVFFSLDGFNRIPALMFGNDIKTRNMSLLTCHTGVLKEKNRCLNNQEAKQGVNPLLL